MIQLACLQVSFLHVLLIQCLLPKRNRIFKRCSLPNAAQAVLAQVGELAHMLTLLALGVHSWQVLLIR